MHISTYQTLHMNYCLTFKVSFEKRCCYHLLLKTKPLWMTKLLWPTVTGSVWIQGLEFKQDLQTPEPQFWLIFHTVFLPTMLHILRTSCLLEPFQIPTWYTNSEFLFFLGKVKINSFLYPNGTPVFLFATLSYYTFGIFDKLSTICFINLCLWSTYNPSLRVLSETLVFFTKSLYKLAFLKPDRSLHMLGPWSKHLLKVPTLCWTDMVLILVQTFNSNCW